MATKAQPQTKTETSLVTIDLHEPRNKQVLTVLSHEGMMNSMTAALPPGMKDQAERLIVRAAMSFAKIDTLKTCPIDKFLQCVVRAAEMGLAIDGRLCHVVPYKGDWVAMPDYKGLVAVAKRSGQVIDAMAELVFENDVFEREHRGGVENVRYVPKSFATFAQRGPIVGAFACFTLSGGLVRYCTMNMEELEEIRRQSSNKREDGPWQKWPREMMRKCPLRRGLKLYSDDPGVLAALEAEDEISMPDRPLEALPAGKSVDLSKKGGNGKAVNEERQREPGEEG